MDDILKSLIDAGFKPVTNDDAGGFHPITGKYICRVSQAGRKTGTSKKNNSPYDFRFLKLQVVHVEFGDDAMGRILDINYKADEDGVTKLLNDLFTAGIDCPAKGDLELDIFMESLVDKTMNVRCWVWTPDKNKDGTLIPEEDRIGRQQVKIVKEFSKPKKSGKTSKADNIPF